MTPHGLELVSAKSSASDTQAALPIAEPIQPEPVYWPCPSCETEGFVPTIATPEPNIAIPIRIACACCTGAGSRRLGDAQVWRRPRTLEAA